MGRSRSTTRAATAPATPALTRPPRGVRRRGFQSLSNLARAATAPGMARSSSDGQVMCTSPGASCVLALARSFDTRTFSAALGGTFRARSSA